MSYVTLETSRTGYDVDQCKNTLTVQELIECLSAYDPDAKIYFSNDNGYTYGSITQFSLDAVYEDDEDLKEIE